MSAVGDTNVHIQVNGTTFSGMYDLIGSKIELISADFGDQSAEVSSRDPQDVAEELLRNMVQKAVKAGTMFVRDDDR